MRTKRLPRAVLFDLDGTLIDSYDAITSSVNEVRRSRNLQPLNVSQVRPRVGRGVESLLLSTVEGTDLSVDIPLYKAHHGRACIEQTRLLPGARELVQSLIRAGVWVGICSNKPKAFTQLILKSLDLSDIFNVVCGPEDAPNPKPDPAMLKVAMGVLGVSAADTLYVGDMTVDVLAGRAAECGVWVVSTGSDSAETLRNGHPDALFEDLWEMAADLGLPDSVSYGQEI